MLYKYDMVCRNVEKTSMYRILASYLACETDINLHLTLGKKANIPKCRTIPSTEMFKCHNDVKQKLDWLI